MIELKLEYNDTSDYLSINPVKEEYLHLCKLSNWGWTSDRVAEDISWVQLCKTGDFTDEDGEEDFYVGFEGSPGIIWVKNGDRAYLEDAYEAMDDVYLILSFDELLEVLQQIHDFLLSVGK